MKLMDLITRLSIIGLLFISSILFYVFIFQPYRIQKFIAAEEKFIQYYLWEKEKLNESDFKIFEAGKLLSSEALVVSIDKVCFT